ncbi:hypothetical protein B0I72DRAFT_159127 [Yarrowia lipolytica]|uniref:YALI0E27434p n=2 Tax=Yarrowia lipolytica TaxID=4952 RepID=Q6C4E5_YARLI|nr:YALI0E27434p [Yarrowia lipolytica CLIB122]KAE8175227.1 hypothetical protein BKA90DRAFT_150079 [Yarrowia lipolytica]RDW27567.1 hypothetical protein B0I71DRAFT_145400 [Yarrowia lipolytica]RDW32168.1 hypothetical protein B0I72DRAFT_159127 [Yarrowia lipolytica]RDW43104.1 hypothetical protein B0I74DRAFT_89690 [Yarrowia lipolytica]RDW49845.1 hypothetical protein B0I75DRAFT_89600 [Yarrowia lipolytica]|eukprot:XP_504467.1 YALI0E27434p [Yarrowia lipolytica CLIB122]
MGERKPVRIHLDCRPLGHVSPMSTPRQAAVICYSSRMHWAGSYAVGTSATDDIVQDGLRGS